jgi:hypothetical protein
MKMILVISRDDFGGQSNLADPRAWQETAVAQINIDRKDLDLTLADFCERLIEPALSNVIELTKQTVDQVQDHHDHNEDNDVDGKPFAAPGLDIAAPEPAPADAVVVSVKTGNITIDGVAYTVGNEEVGPNTWRVRRLSDNLETTVTADDSIAAVEAAIAQDSWA